MKSRKKLDQKMILEAAAALAEQTGLENVTLNRLADRLSVKPPSLYNHLDGLGGLSSGLAALALQRLNDAVRNAAVGRYKADALRQIADAYRRFAAENPQLYKAMLRLPDDPQLKEAGQSVGGVICQVLEPYHCSPEDTLHYVRGFRSAVHGFVSLEQAGFFRNEVSTDESYVRLISGLILALEQTCSS